MQVSSSIDQLSARTTEFVAAMAFVQSYDEWMPFITCYDSLSMINMISDELVGDTLPEGWEWIEHNSAGVYGAGNQKTQIRGIIKIKNFRYTYLGQSMPIICTVIKMPKNIQLVIGACNMMGSGYQQQGSHDIHLDLKNFRAYIGLLQEVVRLDWLPRVISRVKSGPINVISFCGQIEPQLSVLMEMGYVINKCLAFEISETARDIASTLYPMIEYSNVCDVTQAEFDSITDDEWFAAFGSPPCQKHSRRNDNPTADTTVFEGAARLMHYARSESPNMHVLFENVIPDKKVSELRDDWDQLMNMQSQIHQAFDAGSICSRPRLYWIDSIEVSSLQKVTHTLPNFVCEESWYCKAIPMPCLMALGDRTQSPPQCVQMITKEIRLSNPDERDRMQGMRAGFTNAFGRYNMSDTMRNLANGNMFSADSIWHLCREWEVPTRDTIPHSLMTADDVYAADPDRLEKFYMDLYKQGGSVLRDWLTEFMHKYGEVNDKGNLQMPKLHLEPKQNQTVPHQIAFPGDVPAKLTIAAQYAIDKMYKFDQTHELVEYQPKYWISLLFFQPKGRMLTAEWDGEGYNKGDQLEALRPLVDLRAVNDAHVVPHQWSEHSPDRMLEGRKIPEDTKHFKKLDCDAAYQNGPEMSEATSDACVSTCRLRGKQVIYLRSLGGSQGLAAMGTFFVVWIRFGYCFFFALIWIQWWIQHIDDGCAFGPDSERTELRWQLMSISQSLMGLKSASKETYEISSDVIHVGLRWTPEGIAIGEKSVKFLLQVIGKRPKGLKEAQRLRGVILASSTAFHFEPNEKLEFVKLMQPINDAITSAGESKRFSWTDECANAVEELMGHWTNQPRKFSEPSWVCSKTRCLVGQADADPSAISWHLLSVQKPDARDVTPEDLIDPDMVRLLAIHPKTLNKSQSSWHIFELECLAQVHGIRKCGKFINECMAPFIEDEPKKYAWGSDSKLTLHRLPAFHIPDGKLDFLNAKYQRFQGWSEEVAMCRYWPSCYLFTPDAINNLADASARYAAQLRDRMEPGFIEQDSDDIISMPVAVYSYSDQEQTKNDDTSDLMIGAPMDLPEGYEAFTIMFSQSEWMSISQAYSDDHKQYCGVKLSEIFSLLHTQKHSMNNVTRNRVKAWENKLFFPVNIYMGEEIQPIPVLYTMSYCKREMYSAAEASNPPLVLVIPDRVKVRISTVSIEDSPFEAGEEEWNKWYLRDDLIWIAHSSSTPHTTLTVTMSVIKSEVWWPGIEESVRKYIDSCAFCLPLRIPFRNVGLGTQCSVRFKSVEFDDDVLSNDIRERTGYHSVMTIWDRATGTTVFTLRKTKLAAEAYMLLTSRWIAYYGPMTILKSDRDPALAGKLAQMVTNEYGIKYKIETALGNHASGAESKNNYISKAIQAAESKGELRNAQQLELLIAMTQIRVDQITLTDGVTPYEKRHGEIPVTVNQMMDVKKMTQAQIQQIIMQADSIDREFMMAVQQRCEELIQFHNHKAEQRTRGDIANRLTKEHVRPVTDFGFHVGMQVAHGDIVYKILCLPAPGVKAQVEDNQGKVKWISTEKLRPLAVEREEKPIQVGFDFYEGGLILYRQPKQDQILAGVVLTYDEDDQVICVHIHQPCRKSKTWLPRWLDPDKPQKLIRAKFQPKGCQKFCDTLHARDVITVGEFTGPGYCLSPETIYHLRSMGIALQIETSDDND